MSSLYVGRKMHIYVNFGKKTSEILKSRIRHNLIDKNIVKIPRTNIKKCQSTKEMHFADNKRFYDRRYVKLDY